jgi:hypothetical protein
VRDAAGPRRIAGIAVLGAGQHGNVEVLPAYSFGVEGVTRQAGADSLDRRMNRTR